MNRSTAFFTPLRAAGAMLLLVACAGWWLDQLPNARMMLWAHNLHVIRAPQRMGSFLETRYGAAYRPIGQFFGTGAVNATTPGGPVQRIAVGPIKSNTYESAFAATGKAGRRAFSRILTRISRRFALFPAFTGSRIFFIDLTCHRYQFSLAKVYALRNIRAK